jgi:methyl-accepting chemotaxis protein
MKLKIGAKLGLGFGLILLVMALSSLLSYFRLTTIEKNAATITQMRVPTLDSLRRLQTDIQQSASKSRQTILAGSDPARRGKGLASYDDAWDKADKDLTELSDLATQWDGQASRDHLNSVKELLPKLKSTQQACMETAARGGRDVIVQAGNDFADQATPINDTLVKILGELANTHEESLVENKKKLNLANLATVWTLGLSTLTALVIGIAVSFFLSRRISSTIQSTLGQAEMIAAGDLSAEKMTIADNDELGDLARAIDKMRASLKEVIQSISENAQNVANASEEFSAVSQQISANSEETSAQANAVNMATEQVNRGLQTVATATEEMSASIREIAKNTTEAAKVADGAMRTAQDTNAVVAKLGESSAEIGQVIKVITSIAQKTDLLALNATVEAARAGEVGAGFAVVANEVKELAKQTAAATEDISRKIEAIQADAKGAVQAIASISEVIGQVNNISGTIATAVEEQSATTAEMSRNVAEAAKGAGEVAQNIQGVAQAAQSTSHGATDSQKAAKSLAEMSTHLRELVGRFKLDAEKPFRNYAQGNSPKRPAARSSNVFEEKEELVAQ